MEKRITGLDPSLAAYLQGICPAEPQLLQQLREETQPLPGSQMQITPEQANFLSLLVTLLQPRHVLEIGVFRGYSTLAMALALPPDGKIIACDQDPNATAIAQQYWQQAGVRDKIDLRLAPALQTLQILQNEPNRSPFDLIFIDADKRNYLHYYEIGLTLLRPGGVILIDNVLWFGKVADPTHTDPQTQALRDFNHHLAHDRRVKISTLPLGDGMTLALLQP